MRRNWEYIQQEQREQAIDAQRLLTYYNQLEDIGDQIEYMGFDPEEETDNEEVSLLQEKAKRIRRKIDLLID